MNSYLDTSALLKLVIVERETDIVTALWSHVDDPHMSVLGYTEMRAALAASVRSGRLPPPGAAAARVELDSVWRRLIAVEIDEALVRDASDLTDLHRLRAADAIHLASAIRIREPDTAFVAFDARLREAASAEGFLVLPEQV